LPDVSDQKGPNRSEVAYLMIQYTSRPKTAELQNFWLEKSLSQQ